MTSDPGEERTFNPRRFLLAFVVAGTFSAITCSQITIFSIQPIGALPEGKTLVISRMSNTTFIDSADAICERSQAGVSLFCRAAALSAVLESAKIYLRLPYMEIFYNISTQGATYDR